MSSPTTFLDLPIDILLLILPYLDVTSFLRLTSTCKALHDPDFVHNSSYWSACVRRDFRVPNQPVIQHDGRYWQKLYRRLRCDSRVYTWGNNEKGCLGHSFRAAQLPYRRRSRTHEQRRNHIGWPERMEGIEKLGVISDLQCGGWSTILLTAKGELFAVGVLDGMQQNQPILLPAPLAYPPGFPHPTQRYDSSTAIKQLSAGRSHVLALSDSGRIWSWWSARHPALHVKFLHHDLREDGRERATGVVRKVVAGWNMSAALIDGVGIVIWEPLQLGDGLTETEDTAIVLESALVPKTGCAQTNSHRQTQPPTLMDNSELAKTVGEVQDFVVLENAILFSTSLGKVFASQIQWDETTQSVSDPVELPLPDLSATNHEDGTEPTLATDVQGSFRSFAIFTRSGNVLTSNQDALMQLLVLRKEPALTPHDQPAPRLFWRIPALQHRDVISVAFGDHHFHALHASGHITSYGTESQKCGALGLGGHGDPEGRLRGIRYSGLDGDGRLVPHAYSEGRRVWFEEEKRYWIKFMTSGGVDPAEAAERLRMAIGSPGVTAQGEVSEWIEQEGRDWEEKLGVQRDAEDGLGSYFALSVTAAGWHSGALVLVNEELAGRLKAACEMPDDGCSVLSSTSVQDTIHPDQQTSAAAPLVSSTGLEWLTTTTADYIRYFLGAAPYNVSTVGQEFNRESAPNRPSYSTSPEPRNYGASPRPGVLYVWAKDHFPRLKLSDGREMPGTVPFDDWRYTKPDWGQDWQAELDDIT